MADALAGAEASEHLVQDIRRHRRARPELVMERALVAKRLGIAAAGGGFVWRPGIHEVVAFQVLYVLWQAVLLLSVVGRVAAQKNQ